MQTHKKIFCCMIIVTMATMVGYFLLREKSFVGDFFLALLGSSAIATFLELVNYITSKRQLILQVASDNNIISNYICDALWLYNTHTDARKKLDSFIELYEKCQSYVLTLSKEVYEPFYSKEKLTSIVVKNTTAMVAILDILIKGHRQIVLYREARNQLVYKKKDRDVAEKLLDEQLVAVIDQYIEPLKQNECILMDCNLKYQTAYKLLDAYRVKEQDTVIDEIINELNNY